MPAKKFMPQPATEGNQEDAVEQQGYDEMATSSECGRPSGDTTREQHRVWGSEATAGVCDRQNAAVIFLVTQNSTAG